MKSFIEFLNESGGINESPDSFRKDARIYHYDIFGAVTFAVVENCIVYSKDSNATHTMLLQWITDIYSRDKFPADDSVTFLVLGDESSLKKLENVSNINMAVRQIEDVAGRIFRQQKVISIWNYSWGSVTEKQYKLILQLFKKINQRVEDYRFDSLSVDLSMSWNDMIPFPDIEEVIGTVESGKKLSGERHIMNPEMKFLLKAVDEPYVPGTLEKEADKQGKTVAQLRAEREL